MSVEVRLIGSVGAQLFQYAFGRIVASSLGLAYSCVSEEPTSAKALSNIAADFADAPLNGAGIDAQSPIQEFDVVKYPEWDGHRLDLHALLADRSPRLLRLRGYFQRYEYFAAHATTLKRWFAVRGSAGAHRFGDHDIGVLIREPTQYSESGSTLPLSYYCETIDTLTRPGRIVVIADALSPTTRAGFESRAATFIEAPIVERIRIAQGFRRLVLGNAAWAWWAGFLSDAEELYAPCAEVGDIYAFTGGVGVDLHLREDRYREVKVRRPPIGAVIVRSLIDAPKVFVIGDQTLVYGDNVRTRRLEMTKEEAEGTAWLLRHSEPTIIPADVLARLVRDPRRLLIQLSEARVLSVQWPASLARTTD